MASHKATSSGLAFSAHCPEEPLLSLEEMEWKYCKSSDWELIWLLTVSLLISATISRWELLTTDMVMTVASERTATASRTSMRVSPCWERLGLLCLRMILLTYVINFLTSSAVVPKVLDSTAWLMFMFMFIVYESLRESKMKNSEITKEQRR